MNFIPQKQAKTPIYHYICNHQNSPTLTIMTQKQTQEKPILGRWKKFYNHHIPQEKTILDQRRQHLTAWYVVLLILGILADLLEVSGVVRHLL